MGDTFRNDLGRNLEFGTTVNPVYLVPTSPGTSVRIVLMPQLVYTILLMATQWKTSLGY